MCVIVDVNVVHEVFGDKRPAAGEGFYNWVNRGNKLVAGGKLLEELNKNEKFKIWFSKAKGNGLATEVSASAVENAAAALRQDRNKKWKSNDHHIIALAQLSNARLLYSNDVDLHADFKRIRGKVYSTKEDDTLSPAHEGLLRRDHCKRKCV